MYYEGFHFVDRSDYGDSFDECTPNCDDIGNTPDNTAIAHELQPQNQAHPLKQS